MGPQSSMGKKQATETDPQVALSVELAYTVFKVHVITLPGEWK